MPFGKEANCQLIADSATRIGAAESGNLIQFSVWAPYAETLDLELLGQHVSRISLSRDAVGVFSAVLPRDEVVGRTYWLWLDGQRRLADPASRHQPEGVHGPSQFVSSRFSWSDEHWRGLPLDQFVLYELHVGCFSASGDFAGIQGQLDHLVDLGITAIELMPVSQFPGRRNWGYDGVFPFAVQNSYGGADALRELVNACHQRGLAVVLDVVYNHLGPEGNYLSQFGPYFTDRYHTPWGAALNFDGHHSDQVRKFFIDNATHWIEEYHLDGLRLDAIQMIFDNSARPFLAELTAAVHATATRLGRPVYLWGETNQNDVRQIQPRTSGGVGLDGLWNDDFHHALHAKLTGDDFSVFSDHGSLENVARAYQDGFVLQGQYSVHHRRHHGSDSRAIAAKHFVVYSQNHDQIGNRLYGERRGHLVTDAALRLAAAVTILSPYVPMLFMGEEHADPAPFLYFVDHGDQGLLRAVRRGRLRDFHAYQQEGRPVPDPTKESTYRRSRLSQFDELPQIHRQTYAFYRELLRLRRTLPALRQLNKSQHEVEIDKATDTLISCRRHVEGDVVILCHFGSEPAKLCWDANWLPPDGLVCMLDSNDQQWGAITDNAGRPPEIASNAIELLPWQVIALTQR